MKRKAIKQFFKIEPSKWPYNPKRYFKRNGVETADNIKAIKSVYETIPETKRHYKNLPVQYREARSSFTQEYRGWNEEDIYKDRKNKHLNACLIQAMSITAFVFMPLNMFYDKITNPEFYSNHSLIFSFDQGLAVFPMIGMSIAFAICFLITNYKAFTCRNQVTMSPVGYLKVLLKYPSQLSPVHFLSDTLEEKEGEWSGKVFKE